jgi:hypothetical protein
MILGGRELPVQLVGANVRSVLVSHATGVKCCVGDRDHIFARFCFALSDGESVFTGEGFCLEPYELDDDVFAHGCLGTNFLNTEKKRRTGVAGPPFTSTRGW